VELAAGLNLYLASPRADFLRGRYTAANWDVDELEAHEAEIKEKNLLRANLTAEYGDEGYQWKDSKQIGRDDSSSRVEPNL